MSPSEASIPEPIRSLLQKAAAAPYCRPALLGLLIARGALPLCGWANQSVLIEEMENARDMLGLDNNEPGYEVLDTTERLSQDEERHASDLEKIQARRTSQLMAADAQCHGSVVAFLN